MMEATRKKLESMYHCRISYCFDSWNIFSLDGCHWDTCVNYRTLVHTLAKDKGALRSIADRQEQLRHKV